MSHQIIFKLNITIQSELNAYPIKADRLNLYSSCQRPTLEKRRDHE